MIQVKSTQKTRKMRELLRQMAESDESQSAFARRHGVSVSTLKYWRKQLQDDVSFLAVELETQGTTDLELDPGSLSQWSSLQNYLFAGSHKAAQHLAIFYSLFCAYKVEVIVPNQRCQEVLDRINGPQLNKLNSFLLRRD